MEFAKKLGPKHVFGRKIARRRNYEARTGRSILKRQGFGGASESARPENGRKVENGVRGAENFSGSVVRRDAYTRNFGGSELEVAELRSRRFLAV